ncbi:hypothetical protein Dester_1479 [Desulfurobacterium thermolithotrophum DSM 11699]|uniref:Uncharacterized protein n=1 Tax=Desulfurobacterium thermolithotrophum (strain DSM 11699 / BSA) TaxID=868864 RepID=F0S292_DESTD|nr:hypothetical protein [Desulfurobacterium thermolithotrophum]ADY74107.1 hypothetical protein Dester_1479 [Desulfurobacterium thermolithotrophum DSM 11699]
MQLPLFDWLALLSFLFTFILLSNRKLERSRLWTALVTPLASIIGSGYLISAPLLYHIAGTNAWIFMAFIVFLAYLIGEAIRFNILHEESILIKDKKEKLEKLISEVESFSNLALAFAYFISVAFYLRLLSSFIFSGFLERNEALEKAMTSILLLFIGTAGYLRGLNFLEFLEKYAVAVKLSVITGFLTILLFFNIQHEFAYEPVNKTFSFGTLQILGGILLIVQGFETSKYLGEKYSSTERIKSMKVAQLISGFIYVSFIFLVTPLLHTLNINKIDETAIIALASSLSFIMGVLIRTGPLMSQFSAAVADTIGAGGLISAETKGKITSRAAYLLLSLTDILLIWILNVFEVINYASKAFAFYYLLQTVIAITISIRKRKILHAALFICVSFILIFIVTMSKSAE